MARTRSGILEEYIELNMSKKTKFIYIGIALVLYVLVIAFPTYLFTKDLVVLRSVELGLRAGYLVFIILFAYFTKLGKTYTGRTRWSKLFLLLPIFFVAFENIFYLVVVRGSKMDPVINPFSDIFNGLWFFSLIIAAIEEEWLFRYVIQKNLTFGHKIVRILVASAIFAITHFFVMLYRNLGMFNPIDLIEIGLWFGLGIILGVLYEYTNNIAVPITFNVIYSLSNQMLYKVSFSDNPHWSYYLTLSLFAVGGAAYLLVFYYLMLKKEER